MEIIYVQNYIFVREKMMSKITANPTILGGKPIIDGTRISVEFILSLLAAHVSEDEILLDYPHLSKEDIQACLVYAARSQAGAWERANVGWISATHPPKRYEV